MAHELQRIADDDGGCGYCNGATERRAVERVETIAAVPVSLSMRMVVTCRQCRRVTVFPLDRPLRDQLVRTPGVLWRVVITWLWVAFGLIGAVAGAEWARHVDVDKAKAPILGDRWTISTEEWTNLTPTTVFENTADYGVVKVVGFSEEDILVSACGSTFDKESDAEKGCKTFRIAIPQVARADVAMLIEGGAITDLERDDGEMHACAGLGALAAYCLLLGLHGWRTRRFLARRSDAAQV